MKNTQWVAIAAWIATGIAIVIALLLTRSAMCLWAFAFPASMDFWGKNSQEKRDKEEEEIDNT